MKIIKRMETKYIFANKPWYYGYAYFDYNYFCGDVYAIMPINLFIRLYRWAKYSQSDVDKYAREIYQNGMNAGRKFEIDRQAKELRKTQES